MRLIDADDLIQEGLQEGAYGYVSVEEIDEAPVIDAVPVVRCRDCVYFQRDGSKFVCFHTGEVESDDFYCGRGRRKKGRTYHRKLTDEKTIQKYLSSMLFDEQGVPGEFGLSREEKNAVHACKEYYENEILEANVYQFLSRKNANESVVVCEDCALRNDRTGKCQHKKHRNPAKGYCSWGERKKGLR